MTDDREREQTEPEGDPSELRRRVDAALARPGRPRTPREFTDRAAREAERPDTETTDDANRDR